MIIFVSQNFFMDAVVDKLTFQKKIKMYMVFIKFRLSALIIISALSGYLFVGGNDGCILTCLLVGGLLVTGASNGYNQIWERDLDKLMQRTKKRPIPQGNMSIKEGYTVVVVCLLTGTALLYLINIYSALLGLFAFVFYVYIYTPLKRVTPLAVLVGAIPGAIPPMLGAIAFTGEFGLIPGILFFVQFIWQFPHFWAIAWVSHDDYKAGGFSLLPSKKGKSKNSAYQIALYSLILIPVSLSPWFLGLTGIYSFVALSIFGTVFFIYAFKLLLTIDDKDARKLMFASFIYLPVMQFAYVFDRVPEMILKLLSS